MRRDYFHHLVGGVRFACQGADCPKCRGGDRPTYTGPGDPVTMDCHYSSGPVPTPPDDRLLCQQRDTVQKANYGGISCESPDETRETVRLVELRQHRFGDIFMSCPGEGCQLCAEEAQMPDSIGKASVVLGAAWQSMANPSVFPLTEPDHDRNGNVVGTITTSDVISLRDLVALHAMQGLITRDQVLPLEDIATKAYGMADLMLSERAKGGGT